MLRYLGPENLQMFGAGPNNRPRDAWKLSATLEVKCGLLCTLNLAGPT